MMVAKHMSVHWHSGFRVPGKNPERRPPSLSAFKRKKVEAVDYVGMSHPLCPGSVRSKRRGFLEYAGCGTFFLDK